MRVPFATRRAFLAGSTPSHFDYVRGNLLITPTYELRIKKRQLLGIRVIDHRGIPQKGAPVAIRHRADSYTNDLMIQLTDEEGLAVFQPNPMPLSYYNSGEHFVALSSVLKDVVEHPIELTDLPTETITLVTPQTGSISVNLVDEKGLPMTGFLYVRLARIDDGQELPRDRKDGHVQLFEMTTEGRVTFPSVGFDLSMELFANSAHQQKSATQIVAGPTTSNPNLELQVVMKTSEPIIKLRALNEQGVPIASQILDARLFINTEYGNKTSGKNPHTDTQGFFYLKLTAGEIDEGMTRGLKVVAVASQGKPKSEATLDLTREFPVGESDLGDITLLAMPIACSGVILNPDGTPLRDATIRVQHLYNPPNQPERSRWNGYGSRDYKSGPGGSFSISGRLVEGRNRLFVSSAGLLTKVQEFIHGDRDLEIRLEEGGGIKGRFLFDPEINPTTLRFGFTVTAQDAAQAMSSANSQIDADGYFTCTGLVAGTAIMTLRADNTGDHLFQLENIPTIGDDGSLHDLGEIDLRGQLNQFTLTFKDASGQPPAEVRVRTEDRSFGYFIRDEDRINVITHHESLDLIIESPGHQTQLLKGVNRDTIVELQEGFPLRIRLRNPSIIPDGYQLNLRLNRPDARNFVRQKDQKPMDNTFEQVLFAAAPGIHTVELSITKASTIELFGEGWPLAMYGEGPVVEVADMTGEQLFIIEVDQEQLDKAIHQLENP